MDRIRKKTLIISISLLIGISIIFFVLTRNAVVEFSEAVDLESSADIEYIMVDKHEEEGIHPEQTGRISDSGDVEELMTAFEELSLREDAGPDEDNNVDGSMQEYTLRIYYEDMRYSLDIYENYLTVHSMERVSPEHYLIEEGRHLEALSQFDDMLEPIGE